jgi:hypothetical protein
MSLGDGVIVFRFKTTTVHALNNAMSRFSESRTCGCFLDKRSFD